MDSQRGIENGEKLLVQKSVINMPHGPCVKAVLERRVSSPMSRPSMVQLSFIRRLWTANMQEDRSLTLQEARYDDQISENDLETSEKKRERAN